MGLLRGCLGAFQRLISGLEVPRCSTFDFVLRSIQPPPLLIACCYLVECFRLVTNFTMAQEPQITLIDKLAIVPLLLRVLASALLRLITSPFVGGAKAGTLLKDVGFAAVRTMVSNIRTPTETWMNPTTEAAYLDFARSHGLQPKGDVLPSGLKVFWLGSPSAERVVLFFHGGGYAIPASPAHLAWLGGLQRDLAEGHDISILLVAYTLSPYEPYPAQLREAVESLEWLVQKKGVSPSKVGSPRLE